MRLSSASHVSLLSVVVSFASASIAQAPAAQQPAPQAPHAIAPTILDALNDHTTQFRVDGQSVDKNYIGSHLYVCIWKTPPAKGVSLDCTAQGSSVQPTAAQGNSAGAGAMPYVLASDTGHTNITLNTALSAGQAVSIVQVSGLPPNGDTSQSMVSTQAFQVGNSQQCNHRSADQPYSDCDIAFSLVGGVEQAGLSSQPSTTDGFLRAFTRAGLDNSPYQVWAEVRLLSAPQQNSSSGVVAAFTNPSGQITTTTVSNVGDAIDFGIGFERVIDHKPTESYSFSFIMGGGGTTPLSSNTVTEAFTAAPLGTVECNTLYTRFKPFFLANNIQPNSPTNDIGTPAPGKSSSGACLINKNSPASASASTTYAPVSTIGFSNQDRSDFLAKYFVGIRTIHRYKAPGAAACGDLDTANHIAPCSRGVVDFTFGQDESVTGGVLRGGVIKVEAVYPLPIKGTSMLYLFGSFSMRTLRNEELTPLILQTASLTALNGTGSTAVPNVNTVVLPLQQPNRDFYRFGVGLDAICIFSKIFSPGSTCPSSGSTTQ